MASDISLFDGAVWFFVFLFSTTLHEASHAFAALKLGDDTAHRGGQVSLDPMPHIRREPFGMVLVPLLSYALAGWMIGWASAPYDPVWAQRYPKRAGLMALAGPASNLALVIIAGLLIRLGMMLGLFGAPSMLGLDSLAEGTQGQFSDLLATLLSVAFCLNLLLFTFNLIPVPPLDGSSVPLIFLPEETANKYGEFMRNPAFTLFGIIVAWQLIRAIFPPVLSIAIRLLYGAW